MTALTRLLTWMWLLIFSAVFLGACWGLITEGQEMLALPTLLRVGALVVCGLGIWRLVN